jgi:hypothetical protein
VNVKSAVEDETEKMRAELLQKERELIELKKKELQVQLAAQRATLKQHQVRAAQLITVFRIRDPDPNFFSYRIRIFPSRIRIKEFKYFNPKNFKLSEI